MFRFQLAILLLVSTQFAAADEWKKTISQEGNFKIQLPGESKYSSSNLDTNLGMIKLHMFMTVIDSGNTVYMVMYNDYPDELFKMKSTDQILADAAGGVVRNVKGKLQSETKITYGKLPGKDLELTITEKDKVIYVSWRLLLSKNRLYQIACANTGKKLPAETVKKVMKSFQLLQ